MPTVTELIRARLLRPTPRLRPPLKQLRQQQWSEQFEQLMRNRLILGAIRYETFDEKRKNNTYDILGSIRERLALYQKTGNQEHLVDCANLLMIEFECPTHPSPNWSPEDDGVHVQKVDH